MHTYDFSINQRSINNIEQDTNDNGEQIITCSKGGGGFFPLQRLDKAHTAFLVMVNLVDLVRSLKLDKYELC